MVPPRPRQERGRRRHRRRPQTITRKTLVAGRREVADRVAQQTTEERGVLHTVGVGVVKARREENEQEFLIPPSQAVG